MLREWIIWSCYRFSWKYLYGKGIIVINYHICGNILCPVKSRIHSAFSYLRSSCFGNYNFYACSCRCNQSQFPFKIKGLPCKTAQKNCKRKKTTKQINKANWVPCCSNWIPAHITIFMFSLKFLKKQANVHNKTLSMCTSDTELRAHGAFKVWSTVLNPSPTPSKKTIILL